MMDCYLLLLSVQLREQEKQNRILSQERKFQIHPCCGCTSCLVPLFLWYWLTGYTWTETRSRVKQVRPAKRSPFTLTLTLEQTWRSSQSPSFFHWFLLLEEELKNALFLAINKDDGKQVQLILDALPKSFNLNRANSRRPYLCVGARQGRHKAVQQLLAFGSGVLFCTHFIFCFLTSFNEVLHLSASLLLIWVC